MYHKISILVIEDEKSICDFISRTLELNDYEVMTASTGREGLSVITSRMPDLVLLDLVMPKMDGLGALAEIRRLPAPVRPRIVMLSAALPDRTVWMCMAAGADYCMMKPIEGDSLSARS